MRLFTAISRTIGARNRCLKGNGSAAWAATHAERLESWCKQYLPSGSGFDQGCKLSEDSTPERLIFSAPFHHMNDAGMYADWTDHQVIVTASLEHDYSVRVTGRDKRGIKEYIGELFANLGLEDVDCF